MVLWPTFRLSYTPIITEEQFQQVQEMLEENRVVPVGQRRSTHILTGLVKCGKCDWGMSLINRVYVNSESLMIRSCYRQDYETGDRCGNKGLESDIIEETILNVLFETVRPSVLQLSKRLSKDSKAVRRQLEVSEMEELTKMKRELTKQMDNLIDLQLQTGVNERLVIKMKQLGAQLEITEDKIVRIVGSIELGEETWLDRFLEDAEEMIGFPFNYRRLNNEDKNIFLKRYISHVVLLDGEITEIKFTDEIQNIIDIL